MRESSQVSSNVMEYGVVNYIIVTRYRREMIYILTVRQAVQVVGGVQNLLENFLSTSPPPKELSINYTGYIKGPSLRDW